MKCNGVNVAVQKRVCLDRSVESFGVIEFLQQLHAIFTATYHVLCLSVFTILNQLYILSIIVRSSCSLK